mgnify:CR=1 FL=1|jgi:hypothetical protein
MCMELELEQERRIGMRGTRTAELKHIALVEPKGGEGGCYEGNLSGW